MLFSVDVKHNMGNMHMLVILSILFSVDLNNTSITATLDGELTFFCDSGSSLQFWSCFNVFLHVKQFE